MTTLRVQNVGIFLMALAATLALTVSSATAQTISKGLKRQERKPPAPPAEKAKPGDVLKFTMKDIDGKDVDLSQYLGKVVMIVNVASKCGFTKQYAGLEAIYEKYKDQGFVILAFPCNDYKGQEPGTPSEIKKFCTETYKVAFMLFDKVQVKDPKTACDLYKFLTDKHKTSFGGDIKWNFTKFLIDRQGEVRFRFESAVKPDSKLVKAKIERLLKSAGDKSDKGDKKKDADAPDKGKAKGG